MVEVFEYKSAAKTVSSAGNGIMEISDQNGIKCTWLAHTHVNNQLGTYRTNYSWIFDWAQLKAQGCERLTENITVRSTSNSSLAFNVNVDLINTVQTITEERPISHANYSVTYEYLFTPQYTPIPIQKISYDEMFLPSELNDAILVVDGKKLHVNKMFLSYHSEFFRVLFSSNFKEGSMSEIPIEDVSYEEFGLLLSIVYPKTVFTHGILFVEFFSNPSNFSDKTVEKLLEMADRFDMPSVIGHVEYHLLHNTRIGNEKLMWMADAYGMDNLLEKTVCQTSTVEKAKLLKNSPEYKKLSKDAKSIVLDRIMQLI
ncbi:hypothetical protein CRE_21424 [Caenorhabditis remanei]|uniref:BTB domain-containing protein n=1 Tax=Caenorhabditis remanei TaxID=31234 RepID=E3MUV7_CAERE|nr:hypothetical protein CRE_21424 [Caenorhabditis remanei]